MFLAKVAITVEYLQYFKLWLYSKYIYLLKNILLFISVLGEIRTSVGLARLLMGQKLLQFKGLIDDAEFKTGEKEITCLDLQGFWDMVYSEVRSIISLYIYVACVCVCENTDISNYLLRSLFMSRTLHDIKINIGLYLYDLMSILNNKLIEMGEGGLYTNCLK